MTAEQHRAMLTPLPVVGEFKSALAASDAKSKWSSWRRTLRYHMEQKAAQERAFADDTDKANVFAAWLPTSSMTGGPGAAENVNALRNAYANGNKIAADNYLYQLLHGKITDEHLHSIVENADHGNHGIRALLELEKCFGTKKFSQRLAALIDYVHLRQHALTSAEYGAKLQTENTKLLNMYREGNNAQRH